MNNKTIGFTGHRSLFDFTENEVRSIVKCSIVSLRDNKGYTNAIVGMAIGFDQLVADVCVELGFPFVAAVPFSGQEKAWPSSSKTKYYKLIDSAQEKVVVCPGGLEKYKFLKRNEYIVNHSDLLLAYLKPGTEKGGTAHCVRYAQEKGIKVKNLYDMLLSTKNKK